MINDLYLTEKRYRTLDENGELVPANVLEWGQWFEDVDNRRIARTVVSRRKKIYVSTVCLGVECGFMGGPRWFETMVFGSSLHEYIERYATKREAELGHARAVARVRQARWTKNRDSVKESGKDLRKLLKKRKRAA